MNFYPLPAVATFRLIRVELKSALRCCLGLIHFPRTSSPYITYCTVPSMASFVTPLPSVLELPLPHCYVSYFCGLLPCGFCRDDQHGEREMREPELVARTSCERLILMRELASPDRA